MIDWITFLAGFGTLAAVNIGVSFLQHWQLHREFNKAEALVKALNAVGHDHRFCDICRQWSQHANEALKG
jgi:hypothetical protein